MNLPVCLLLGFASLAAASLRGEVIVSDSFAYAAGSLNGANGGAGWNSAWTATAVSSVAGGEAQFGTGSSAPNGNELAYRSFGAYSGDALFISLTITATGHEGNDFFALWLDSAASTGGSDNHGTSRLNVGLSSGNLFTRLSASAERTSTGPAASNGETYTLVVAYTKSVPGSASAFDTVSWWLNPTAADYASPTGTVSGSGLSTLLSSVSAIGFRGAANEASDQYRVDSLMLATTWADVAAIPEPGTFALLTGAAALGGVLGLRRR